MTSVRALRLPALFALVVLVALLVLPATPARAGGDDFEYGRALAALGTKTGDAAYFELARRVFNGVIADENRSEADKDLCRYGLAEMTRSEAMGATGGSSKPYKDVLGLFKDAISTMESFVTKNPEHVRADEASLLVGTTRLGFVQWARDLLGDPERASSVGARSSELKQDAEDMVRGAIRYFDKLRKGHDEMDATQVQQLAQYYWVLCQYYLALVFEPESEAATEALEQAAVHLDDFITLNDGQLLAIYAQDIFGLTRWEQARQTNDEDKKASFYRQAVEWFETCIETEVTDVDSQRVVANGYYHLGQVCNEAGRVGATNFHKLGVSYLEDMEGRHPTLWRQDNGIRAMLEWAKLERKRDRNDEAIAIAERAGSAAKKLGKGWLEALANRALSDTISDEGGGGSGANVKPEVLLRVAHDLYSGRKYVKAIAAYQKVLGAVERRVENVEEFIVPSWERISSAYQQQGDLMAAALSLDPIHGIWIDGLVEKVGGADDENMIRFGNIRRRAMKYWKQLHTLTGSPLFNRRHNEIRDSFTKDYPEHPTGGASLWNSAMEKWRQALKQMKDKNSRWRSTMKEADDLFVQVARDDKSQKQDTAWTYQIYSQYIRENWRAMLAAHAKASAFWDSAKAKAQAKKFPTVAKRRKPEIGKATYWKAEALYRLATAAADAGRMDEATKGWDDVMKTLEGWHVEYDMLRPQKRFYAGALGHLVFAHIGKGDIPEADKVFRRLLAEDPQYLRLPKITFRLAKHFNDKAKVIDKDRKAARAELKGTREKEGVRTRLRAAIRQEHIKVEYLVDVEGRRTKTKELIEAYDKAKAEADQLNKPIQTDITVKMYDDAKALLPKLDADIQRITAEVNKLGAEKQTLEKRASELVEVIKAKAQELYDPLTRAAGYFWEWDKVLRENELERDPGNVSIFADLYFTAGLLRPETSENWERARVLYESYLQLPGITDDDKHESLGRLGTIYGRLARAAEEGSEARGQLVQKALDRLQGSLALIPENNDLVVGLLQGDIVVIPWKYERANAWYYFPMSRVKTVDEFRKAIAAMGKPGGPPVPKQATDIAQRQYANAIRAFQNHVTGMKEPALARTVKGFEKAGFDMRLYKRLAESGTDFRLALAWIYTQSGSKEHMTKAYNLASSLVGGTYGAEEFSEQWWEAQTTRLTALVVGSELESADMAPGGKAPVTAVEWALRASNMLRGLNTTSPDLGDLDRPETRGELKGLLARIKALIAKLGNLPSMDDVILDRIPGGG